MMARDLNDAWGWIERLVRRVDRLYSGALLENSSITNGRMRFIGGRLRLDSGALLELIGQWRFFGNGAITGDVVAEGRWTQNGDWEFNGDGDLAGNVKLSGDFDLTGKFTAGNVRIQDGKIYVGVGANLIVVDGATGKITAGNLTIDPAANGGSVKFASGPEVYANGPELSLYSGGAWITLTNGLAKISSGGLTWVEITLDGFKLVGVPTKTAASTGLPAGVAHLDSSGNLFRIT